MEDTLGLSADVKDSDGDGLGDEVEANLWDGAWVASDHDEDDLPNHLDVDSDDDGLPDGHEPFGLDDPDGDGLPSIVDPDADGDGVEDGLDRTPGHSTPRRTRTTSGKMCFRRDTCPFGNASPSSIGPANCILEMLILNPSGPGKALENGSLMAIGMSMVYRTRRPRICTARFWTKSTPNWVTKTLPANARNGYETITIIGNNSFGIVTTRGCPFTTIGKCSRLHRSTATCSGGLRMDSVQARL